MVQGWSQAVVSFGTRGETSRGAITTRRLATVYGQDGWLEEEESSSYFGDNALFASPSPSLIDSLLQHTGLGELARLAAAFSPHAVALQDIQDVQVVNVDEHHVDLSAVVCEDSGCVTLFCPISFPHDCLEASHLESCVLDNIHELDHHAEERLLQQQQEQKQEQQCNSHVNEKAQLISQDGVEYPDWWVFAIDCLQDPDMETECNTVKSLLNTQDFTDTVQELAEMMVATDGLQYLVESAGVASVGPAGIYLRAKVWSAAPGLSEEPMLLDLPIRFDEPVSTIQELQSTVLHMVARASS